MGTPAAFWEMVKLTRPGGYIVNVMREADRRDCALYKNHFDVLVQRLLDEGRLELVFSHINAGYAAGEDGLVQVFKVKNRAHLKPGYWTGNAPQDEEEDRGWGGGGEGRGKKERGGGEKRGGREKRGGGGGGG